MSFIANCFRREEWKRQQQEIEILSDKVYHTERQLIRVNTRNKMLANRMNKATALLALGLKRNRLLNRMNDTKRHIMAKQKAEIEKLKQQVVSRTALLNKYVRQIDSISTQTKVVTIVEENGYDMIEGTSYVIGHVNEEYCIMGYIKEGVLVKEFLPEMEEIMITYCLPFAMENTPDEIIIETFTELGKTDHPD